MREETYQIEKELENRHSIVNNVESIPKFGGSGPMMEGYLFKRTSNAFKTWNRRWFYLYDNKLVYRWGFFVFFLVDDLIVLLFYQKKDRRAKCDCYGG